MFPPVCHLHMDSTVTVDRLKVLRKINSETGQIAMKAVT